MAQCTARTRSGRQCKSPAVAGATVCRMHGGSAPQVRAAADRRLKREAAERAVIEFGLRREIDPHDALLEEVQRAAHLVGEYGAILAQIDRDRLVHGVVKVVDLPPSQQNPQGGKRVEAAAARAVWLQLYNEERDRLTRTCDTAIRCGVAERQVELAEQQAQQLARVVTAILTDLGHDLADPGTREVVRLRLLEGGRAA